MTSIPASNSFVSTSSLANGTYHFGLGGDASLTHGVHFKWDSALVGVITIWTSQFDPTTVPVNSVVAGDWIQQQPTSRYVAISPAGAATESNLTVTIPGGTAGGCCINLGNFGDQRLKAQVVITTPGALRGQFGGKE